MNSFFVDTSFWKALVDQADNGHDQAKAAFASLNGKPYKLFTTDYVFSETVTLLGLRPGLGKAVAQKWGDLLLSSKMVALISVSEKLFLETWTIFKKHADKKYSFVDCSSFAVMQKFKLQTALTLDHHFKQFGFSMIP